MATGFGLLFTLTGLLLVTNYRGAGRWLMNSADASLDDVPLIRDPLRRFNTRFFFGGDQEHFAYFKSHVVPLVVGGGFVTMGGAVLLIGLVRLFMLLP